jgi:hypothetical protein
MKDGTTHLAYKPEHAVDLDTGVVVAAPIHPADDGDTTTLSPTLEVAERNLGEVGLAPSEEEPCALAADKGAGRRRLENAHRRARTANRARLKSGIGPCRREWAKDRSTISPRLCTFSRPRSQARRSYLIRVAGFNLGVLMRALHGQGTPREAAEARAAFIFVLRTDSLIVFGMIAVTDDEYVALVVTIELAPTAT